MKNKGFTLIELLAVIIIIGIIAIITTPIVMNTINDVKKSTFSSSVAGLVKAVRNDALNNNYGTGSYRVYNGQLTYNGRSIKVKGGTSSEGVITIDANSRISLTIKSEQWCATRLVGATNVTITEGTCNIPPIPSLIDYSFMKNLPYTIDAANRNLLKGSATNAAWFSGHSPAINSLVEVGKITSLIASDIGAWIPLHSELVAGVDWNSVYTISIDLKISAAPVTGANLNWQFRRANATNFKSINNNGVQTMPINEWKRFTLTTGTTTAETMATMYLYLYGTYPVGTTIEYKNIKIEAGSTATTWDVATSDAILIDSQLSSLEYQPTVTGPNNQIVLGTNPWGKSDYIWKGMDDTTSLDGGLMYGGLTNSRIPIDNKKPYRISVWVKKNNTTGSVGIRDAAPYSTQISAAEAVTYVDGTSASLFPTISVTNLNEWLLAVYYIYPYHVITPTTNLASVYQTNGTILSSIQARRFNSTSNFFKVYVGSYGTTSTVGYSYFYRPRMDVVDGTEPTIANLLAGSENSNLYGE